MGKGAEGYAEEIKAWEQAGKLWDKMMIEDERVSEIETSYLWSLVMREVAHVAALEAKVACRDATIRDLRARVLK